MAQVHIRRAVESDADAAASLYQAARQAAIPAIPPPVHSCAETRKWIGDSIRDGGVWVAEASRSLHGLMMLDGSFLDQLYVAPGHTGQGIGQQLLDQAKALRPGGLRLWTFASNIGARRFYERHGFHAVEETDGSGNEERAPDVLYMWP